MGQFEESMSRLGGIWEKNILLMESSPEDSRPRASGQQPDPQKRTLLWKREESNIFSPFALTGASGPEN